MRDSKYLIAAKGYYFSVSEMSFEVRLFHFPWARNNEYELYRNDELATQGKCPIEYTPEKIMHYHMRVTPEQLQAASIEDEAEMEF